MGNTDSFLLPNNTNLPKRPKPTNTKRCDLCQKLINLDTNIFYIHDPVNHTIQRCFFDKGITHIAETFPTTIIDKDKFTACEECDEINSLSPPLFVKKEENYTCSLCKKTVHAYLKSNSNATSRFDSFLCRNCFKKFCCYGECKRINAMVCGLCKLGFCKKHRYLHANTVREKELEGIRSYSCCNTRLGIDLYEAEMPEEYY